jgi:hypothetical protein
MNFTPEYSGGRILIDELIQPPCILRANPTFISANVREMMNTISCSRLNVICAYLQILLLAVPQSLTFVGIRGRAGSKIMGGRRTRENYPLA